MKLGYGLMKSKPKVSVRVANLKLRFKGSNPRIKYNEKENFTRLVTPTRFTFWEPNQRL